MKYLSFVRSAEKYRESQPPPALMEAMGRLIEKFNKQGALVATGGLAASRSGKTKICSPIRQETTATVTKKPKLLPVSCAAAWTWTPAS